MRFITTSITPRRCEARPAGQTGSRLGRREGEPQRVDADDRLTAKLHRARRHVALETRCVLLDRERGGTIAVVELAVRGREVEVLATAVELGGAHVAILLHAAAVEVELAALGRARGRLALGGADGRREQL